MTESPQRGVSRIALLRNTPTGTPGSGVFHLCITAILARRGHGTESSSAKTYAATTRASRSAISSSDLEGTLSGSPSSSSGGSLRTHPTFTQASTRRRAKARASRPARLTRRSGCTSVGAARAIASRCPTSASRISRGRSSASSSWKGASSTRAIAGRSAATPRAARSVSRLPLLRTMRERLRSDFAQSGRAIFS